MRKTTFWVFWRRNGSARAHDFASEAEARQHVGDLVEHGAEGVRLEKHEPSPYHQHFDITTLYPEPEG